jgi:hypothetical protein
MTACDLMPQFVWQRIDTPPPGLAQTIASTYARGRRKSAITVSARRYKQSVASEYSVLVTDVETLTMPKFSKNALCRLGVKRASPHVPFVARLQGCAAKRRRRYSAWSAFVAENGTRASGSEGSALLRDTSATLAIRYAALTDEERATYEEKAALANAELAMEAALPIGRHEHSRKAGAFGRRSARPGAMGLSPRA